MQEPYKHRRQDALFELTKRMSEVQQLKYRITHYKQFKQKSIQEIKVQSQFGEFGQIIRKKCVEVLQKNQSQQMNQYSKVIQQAEQKLVQIKQKWQLNQNIDQGLQIYDTLMDIAGELQKIQTIVKQKKKFRVQFNQQMLYAVIRHCIAVHIDGDLVFGREENDQNDDGDQNKKQQQKQQKLQQQQSKKNYGDDNLNNSTKNDQDLWLISPLEANQQIYWYNITRKQIKLSTAELQFQQGYGLCSIRNACYIAGGHVGHISENKVVGRCYKIDVQKMSTLQKLNKSRNRLALSGLAYDTIFATGGRTQQSIVAAQKYSISKNKWTDIEDLIDRRSAHASCQFQNRYVFVFMGTNGKNDLNSIEMYDDNISKTWKLVIIKGNTDNLIATNCLGSSQTKDAIYLWSKFMNNYKSFFRFEFEDQDESTPILNCKQIEYNKKFCNSDSTCPICWSRSDNSIISVEYANKSVWRLKNDNWEKLKEQQFKFVVQCK